MIDWPKYIKLAGTGTFGAGDFQMETSFDLQRQFSHTVLSVEGSHPIDAFASQFTKGLLGTGAIGDVVDYVE